MRKLLAALAIIALPASAIIKGEAPPEGDTRWDAVGALNGYCSAVLVGPGAILTARHCVAYPGDYAVSFRTGETAAVSSFYLPEGGDAAIGYLSAQVVVEPVPVSFAGSSAGAGLLVAGYAGGELLTCATWTTWAAPESYIQFPPWSDPTGPGCGPESGDSGGGVIVGSRARRVVGIIVDGWNATNLARYSDDPNFQALSAP